MKTKRTLKFESEKREFDPATQTTETKAITSINVHEQTKIVSALGDLCLAINPLLEQYEYSGKAKPAEGDVFDEYKGNDISALKYRSKAQFDFGKMALKASDKAWELMKVLEAFSVECSKNGLLALAKKRERDERE